MINPLCSGEYLKFNTLDEIHKNYMDKFKKNKENLENLKDKLNKKKVKLYKLEKKNPKKYTEKDIKDKADLKTIISYIEKDIYNIENNVYETDYYSKTFDILLYYYGDNNVNLYYDYDEQYSNSDSSLIINNKKKKQKRNKKKINKNKKKISSYFIDDIPSKEKKPKFRENKADILKSYKMMINNNYLSYDINKNDKVPYCDNCNKEKKIIKSDGIVVCDICGESETIIMENEKSDSNDNKLEKPGCPYKRINHLKELLSQFQAKESIDIPAYVYNDIITELNKNKFYDLKKLSKPYVRIDIIKPILKKLGYQKYYEHISYIISNLSGVSPPTISKNTEELFCKMFKEIQKPFEKYCPSHRFNFLSYSYVLHKFCELLELDDLIPCFPLLKTRSKLVKQDEIWKKICYELNWKFYPST